MNAGGVLLALADRSASGLRQDADIDARIARHIEWW
ncbi:MAG: hypothetical protein ING75_11175 [Rhodocyclaceae bacterium]|nr:hypothetical protein [Rhodocyclaceae bacterium]